MKTMTIPLTQGKFAIVDAEDCEFLMQWKWCYSQGYAVRNGPSPERGLILMHRVILERVGLKDFAETDHINRDRADNRKCNLRAASRIQNGCNRNKQKNNSSGYTGICWCKRHKKWMAKIQVSGKVKFLGYFNNKKEAARVYNLAARMYHGDFSVLNKV